MCELPNLLSQFLSLAIFLSF